MGDLMLNTLIPFAYISAISAMLLLLVAVYYLQYSPDATGLSTDTVYTSAPRWSALAIIAIVGAGSISNLSMGLAFCWGNGWQPLVDIFSHHQPEKDRPTYVVS